MRYLVCLLWLACMGCGGDSGPSISPSPRPAPTPAPTPAPAPPPAPAPIPAASLQLSGQGSFTNCIPLFDRCDFQASLQNVGTGCATSTSAVARFYDGNGAQMGSDAQLGAVGASLASRTIRPQEIVAVGSINTVTYTIATTSKSYRLFPTWTNVRCP